MFRLAKHVLQKKKESIETMSHPVLRGASRAIRPVPLSRWTATAFRNTNRNINLGSRRWNSSPAADGQQRVRTPESPGLKLHDAL